MYTRKHLFILSMILASNASLINTLNQPQCIRPGSKPFVEQRWSTTVGPLFNFARYKFDTDVGCCNGPTNNCCEFPHAQGYLAGIHVDISHSRPSHWFFNLQFDGEWNAGYVNNTENMFLQIKDYRPETDFGYTFFINKNHYFITPFTGFGFYHLSTEFKKQMLTNKYNNIYIPIGFNATWNVHPECYEDVVECFTMGITASYRIDAWTRLKVVTDGGVDCPNGLCPDLCCDNSCNKPCTPKICNPCDDRLKPQSRTQGVHTEIVCTWFPTFNNDSINFIATGGPFFDWNRFGGACATSCESCATVPVAQLTRWYLGFHAQLGLRF